MPILAGGGNEKEKAETLVYSFCLGMNFGFVARTIYIPFRMSHTIYCAQSKCEKRSIILAHAHSHSAKINSHIFSFLLCIACSTLPLSFPLSLSLARLRSDSFHFAQLISPTPHLLRLFLHIVDCLSDTVNCSSCILPPPLLILPWHGRAPIHICHSAASYNAYADTLVLRTRTRKFHALFTVTTVLLCCCCCFFFPLSLATDRSTTRIHKNLLNAIRRNHVERIWILYGERAHTH